MAICAKKALKKRIQRLNWQKCFEWKMKENFKSGTREEEKPVRDHEIGDFACANCTSAELKNLQKEENRNYL